MSEENKGLYGELPQHPVVFAACDDKYFEEHAPAFVYSADKVGKDVHIHVINPTEKTHSLATILNSTSTVKTTFSYHQSTDLGRDSEETRTLYACVRFIVLPHIVRAAGKVLVLDIDCMLMNEFDYPETPTAYFPRTDNTGASNEWEQKGMSVAAGAVYFDDRAIPVVDGIYEGLQGAPLRWFVDQVVLSEVFKQVPEDIVTKFDSQFMDWEFKEGTTIWTGKGPRKYDNPVYVAKKQEMGDYKSKISGYDEVLLRPRLDIPFKQFQVVLANSVNEPIRKFWSEFCDRIVEGENKTLVLEMARWQFNSSIQSYFDEEIPFYVPHEERHSWGGHDQTYFYMQSVFPWLFSVDHEGWGGGAEFVNTFDPSVEEYDDAPFDELRKYALNGGTKFPHLQPQENSGSYKEFLKDEFICVPLQIPHDMVIKYHSAISVEEFVTALCKWAEKPGNPQVVFKGHPVNLSSMVPLMNIIEQYDNVLYFSQVHIHELIDQAAATYVINSGTGQEAMLMNSTVVSFGDSEYRDAVISGNLNDLDGAWKAVKSADKEKQETLYRKWYSWYASCMFDARKQTD
jgi:hypothetical protein